MNRFESIRALRQYQNKYLEFVVNEYGRCRECDNSTVENYAEMYVHALNWL